MTKDEIKAEQRRIGVLDDGDWGPVSMAACQRHLRKLMDQAPQKWPNTDQKSLTAFYGRPGDESQLVALNVAGLGILYEGMPVVSIRCHHKVAASFRRILEKLAKDQPWVLKQYAGVYNNRLMRGGSLPSLHARGAAGDFWPDANGLNTPWPTKARMPLAVMEAFAAEGWVSSGAFWVRQGTNCGRDAMHFQATTL